MPSSIQQSTKSLSQGNRSFSFIFAHLPFQILLIILNLLDSMERLEVREIDLIECNKAFEKSLEQHLPLLLMSTGYVTSICACISHSQFFAFQVLLPPLWHFPCQVGSREERAFKSFACFACINALCSTLQKCTQGLGMHENSIGPKLPSPDKTILGI